MKCRCVAYVTKSNNTTQTRPSSIPCRSVRFFHMCRLSWSSPVYCQVNTIATTCLHLKSCRLSNNNAGGRTHSPTTTKTTLTTTTITTTCLEVVSLLQLLLLRFLDTRTACALAIVLAFTQTLRQSQVRLQSLLRTCLVHRLNGETRTLSNKRLL